MRSIFILLALLITAIPVSVHAKSKPNFVLIFIDDMGYGDIGPFGSKVNKTPQLDQMASEGMKLTPSVCDRTRSEMKLTQELFGVQVHRYHRYRFSVIRDHHLFSLLSRADGSYMDGQVLADRHCHIRVATTSQSVQYSL